MNSNYIAFSGETVRFGKMSLSLWQQATCVRTRVNPDNNEQIIVETLYMRPIFSGSTADSNREHNIAHWLNVSGIDDKQIICRA